MFNFIRRFIRGLFGTQPKKKYYKGIPIKWCRALILKDLRCKYTGRFCNPGKLVTYPCPVALRYLNREFDYYSAGTSELQM